jgi:hypothetical protein
VTRTGGEIRTRASAPPVVRLALVSWAMLMTSTAVAHAQAPVAADEVMAAFVHRFPEFVEWPAMAFDNSDVLEICVGEPDPLTTTLQRLIEGEELNGLPLTMRALGRSRDLDGCHVLYLSSETERQDALLQDAADRPILTVGDAPDFLDAGVIIQLKVVERRIRFEINSKAADRAGLRLSSQLMDLALAVHGGPS